MIVGWVWASSPARAAVTRLLRQVMGVVGVTSRSSPLPNVVFSFFFFPLCCSDGEQRLRQDVARLEAEVVQLRKLVGSDASKLQQAHSCLEEEHRGLQGEHAWLQVCVCVCVRACVCACVRLCACVWLGGCGCG